MRTAVWNVSTPSRTPVSFTELQSEQLVEKLADKDDKASLHDSLASHSAASEQVVEEKRGEAEIDASYALALQLQEQFDRENEQLRSIARKQESGKVALGTRYSQDYRGQDLDESEESEGDFYGEDYWEDEEYEDMDVLGSGVRLEKPHHQRVKTDGRLSKQQYASKKKKSREERLMDRLDERIANGEIVTKHDAELNGARNTDYMENLHPEQSLGNMSGNDVSLPNSVFNSLKAHAMRSGARGIKKKHNESVQTRDSVIDKPTRLILHKLVNAGTLEGVNGCVSEGKEAAVFHAVAGAEAEYGEYAVKVFKTTISSFKTRSKYVVGEHRFRNTLSKQNPRKLIRLWAEKEMRNLLRAEKAELRCPHPIFLRDHVLLMQFIGQDGVAAPKLKDARLNDKRMAQMYRECALMMRKLYQECKLVHSDLSEYNILYWKKHLYFIDVSQAVEHEHPNALSFLRSDCKNVSNFFRRSGVANTLSVRQLYRFVRMQIAEGEQDKELDAALAKAQDDREQGKVDDEGDEVWSDAFLPRNLSEVNDCWGSMQDGHKDLFNDSVVSSNSSENEDDDDNDDCDDNGAEQHKQRAAKKTSISKEERKKRKKAAKAAQRERRAQKSGISHNNKE